MAITSSARQAEQLDERAAWLAAVASILLALGAVAALTAYLLANYNQAAFLTAYQVGWIALAMVVVAVSTQMMRRQTWAQRFLLTVWTLTFVGAAVAALGALLWGVPEWWPQDRALLSAALAALLGGSGIVAALLYRASAARSRLRYASVVTISAGVAVAVTIVVNMIAQTDYVRRSVESLGRYRLSERTGKILDAVDQPIRLTCVYTSLDKKTPGREFGPRVLELLEEMNERNRKIEVANVTSDAEKVELLERLRGQLGGQAQKHTAYLDKALADLKSLLKTLQADRPKWTALSGETYLEIWGAASEIDLVLQEADKKLSRTVEEVERKLHGPSLPDYAALVSDITDALKPIQDEIDKQDKRLRDIAEVLAAVSDPAKRQAALDSVNNCLAAAQAMVGAVGGEKDPLPADAAQTLRTFADAAQKAANQTRSTARMLEAVGGNAHGELVRNSRYYLLVIPTQLGPARIDLVALLDQSLAASLDEMAADARSIVQVAKPEFQKETISRYRQEMAQHLRIIQEVCKAARTAVEKLAAADPPSKDVLAKAKDQQLFAALKDPFSRLLEDAKNLPELKSGTLTSEIGGENIVIVETADKAEVVPFDEVWPLKVRPTGMPMPDEPEQSRTFNGDSAIGSRLLRATSPEPFATVLLAFYEPEVPPQMRRMMPQPDLSPQNLTALRTALEEANFEVKEWSLAQDKPVAEKARPEVLLVLPPAPPAPASPYGGPPEGGFGPEQQKKLADAIDAGIPAIFLANYSSPPMNPFMPMPDAGYALGDYLRTAWGLDVKTDYRVIPAVVNESAPDVFKVDPIRFSFLPLNTFSEHSIGQPLQGQRVLWNDLCPVEVARNPQTGSQAALPKGVEIATLLEVPEWWPATWATRNIRRLIQQIQSDSSGIIHPDFPGGDIPAGFPVAVAATRQEGEGVHAARIVVLGMGSSLADGYLNEQVPVLGGGNTIELADPPRTNADLVVNSAFWLVGMKDKIAAGPLRIKPVENVKQGTLGILWALFVIGLPAATLALGGLVLFLRRR